MDISDVLRGLVHALRAASSFDEGCTPLLDALRSVGDGALAPRGARAVRGIVHARTATGGYRALAIRELQGGPHPAVLPSASVWSAVERTGGGIVIDLGTCRGTVFRDGTPVEVAPAARATESVQEMRDREVTHVLALPLRSGAEIGGMACIELVWPTYLAKEVPLGPWCADLETIADVASPILAALPQRDAGGARAAAEPDERLPVVGERTRAILRLLEVFVAQDETLLVIGPTGAGKSRLAEWCHARSARAHGPFETANLLAVPEAMQLAELFGWRRGAFTGAHADHDGLVAAADGGTLFLDEIDKLSMAAQAGLLRLLDTRRFSPLGAARERTADVRFIVATNADLRELVRTGAFREDLYYRINVFPVRLAPLAERRDELPGWASVMLARRHRESGRAGEVVFAPDALSALGLFDWPGNLRQLDNVVRRAYAIHLATHAGAAAGGLERIGRDVVDRALAFERGEGDAPGHVGALRALADAIVERAIAERSEGRTLALDPFDGLRGAVLRAAVERMGSVRGGYLLFGADALVESRNHSAAYKRELAQLDALERVLRGR